MDYQEFTSDLRCPTIVCHSVEEIEETLAVFDVDQQMRQLGNGRLKSHIATRTVGDTEFFADRYSTAVSLHLRPPQGTVGFMLPRSASGRFLASGENVGEHKLVFVTDSSGTDVVVPPLAGSEDIAIPPERFVQRMAALCPTVNVPDRATSYEGDTSSLHEIRQSIVDVVSTPDTPVSSETLANLVDRTIAWLGEAAPYWGPESLTINAQRQRIAKKVQEFLEEHFDDCVRMEDLCKEAGVGVRSLQRCFRDYFDITVSEYLKTKRLDAAHRELDSADMQTTTVTEIALNNGFNHLGRFSVEFKDRFGESPSVTLATKEDQKSVVREIPASEFLASADLVTTVKGG